MSEPPDLDALAKQYLDLWQDQLGGISKDRQAAEIMAQTVELMNTGAQAFASMVAVAQGNFNQAHDTASSKPTNPSHPATDGAASGASDVDLADLALRLERIEKRLDTLEAGAKKSSRKPSKKPRKG